MTGIFRAYDIRGVYPGELDESLAEKIGRAFGTFILRIQPNSKKIAVAGDVRLSTETLKKALINGIVSTGLDVTDLGITPTPVFYFAISKYGFDGGIMVTASHLPPEFNGFKLCKRSSVCLRDETGINDVENIVNENKFFENKNEGRITEKDVSEDYIEFISSKVKIGPIKVVVDAGNGTTGKILPELLERFGCDVAQLFCEPDGRFPNHIADPLKKETLRALQKKVVEEKADLGIAMDNDGDRVGFVDREGNIIENNHILCMLAKNVLKYKKGKIVFDLLCSSVVGETIRRFGGMPVETRVGHSFIQNTLITEKCILGGEASAHYYFPETFNCDDGIFAALKVVEAIGRGGMEFIESIPACPISDDIRIYCPDAEKFEKVEQLKQKFKKEGFEMNTMDGVKVYLPADGWFCIRPSNTQPVIDLRFEGKTKEGYERIKDMVRKEIEWLGLDSGKIC